MIEYKDGDMLFDGKPLKHLFLMEDDDVYGGGSKTICFCYENTRDMLNACLGDKPIKPVGWHYVKTEEDIKEDEIYDRLLDGFIVIGGQLVPCM